MDRQTYRVNDGVAWVAGKPTPDDRLIELTPEEALCDLGLDRIALVEPPAPDEPAPHDEPQQEPQTAPEG